MKIIEPYYEILTPISEGGIEELKQLELAARNCYKSEDSISEDGTSAISLLKKIITKGHTAMLEHGSLSVRFVVDRGVSHELVRHRLASYAQESTRYCNYLKDKFENEITVIRPWFFEEGSMEYFVWGESMKQSEEAYFVLLLAGRSPQEARSVLPNSLKTEVIMTANYREWRQVLELRTSNAAHPQIRQVMIPLLKELQRKIPVIFDDVGSLIDPIEITFEGDAFKKAMGEVEDKCHVLDVFLFNKSCQKVKRKEE